MGLAQDKKQRTSDGQIDLFSMGGALPAEEPFSYPPIDEYPLEQRLQTEKELTGMWFSGHPLSKYQKNIEALSTQPLSDLTASLEEGTRKDGEKLTLCGMMSAVSIRNAKSGKKYATATLEDAHGAIDLLIFENALEACKELVKVGTGVYVEGRLSFKEDEPAKVVLSDLIPLLDDGEFERRMAGRSVTTREVPAKQQTSVQSPKEGSVGRANGAVQAKKPSKLYVRLTGEERKDRQIDALISIFEGQIPCIYYDRATATYRDSGKRISPSPYWLSVLKKLAGEENVVLK